MICPGDNSCTLDFQSLTKIPPAGQQHFLPKECCQPGPSAPSPWVPVVEFRNNEFGKGGHAPQLFRPAPPPKRISSRLPLNSVGAGDSEAGKEACTEPQEPRRRPTMRETAAAMGRDSLRFPGKGEPRTTHPSASSVSSTSPSIVGSGPGSGPLMVLRPEAVPFSKEPAGNQRPRCQGSGRIST